VQLNSQVLIISAPQGVSFSLSVPPNVCLLAKLLALINLVAALRQEFSPNWM